MLLCPLFPGMEQPDPRAAGVIVHPPEQLHPREEPRHRMRLHRQAKHPNRRLIPFRHEDDPIREEPAAEPFHRLCIHRK